MRNYDIVGRTSHVVKTFCLVALMILDLYFSFHILYVDASRSLEDGYNGVNNIDFSAEARGLSYVIGAYFVVQLMLIFWLFFSVWQTFLFKFRAGDLCYQFSSLFMFFVLNFAFFIVEIVIYIIRVTDVGNSATLTLYSMWKDTIYVVFFWIRRVGILIINVVMVGFYGFAFTANIDLGHPYYYKPQRWISG